jgi:hypothetical protein
MKVNMDLSLAKYLMRSAPQRELHSGKMHTDRL